VGSLGAFLARGPLTFGHCLFETFNELVQLLLVLLEYIDYEIQDIYLFSERHGDVDQAYN